MAAEIDSSAWSGGRIEATRSGRSSPAPPLKIESANGAIAIGQDRRHERGGDLAGKRDPDEPVEPAPVVRRGVAEAVFDERVVAREPDDQRQEVGRADHDREPAGPHRPEHAQHDERGENAEGDRGVDAGERGQAAPGQAEGRQRASSRCRTRGPRGARGPSPAARCARPRRAAARRSRAAPCAAA